MAQKKNQTLRCLIALPPRGDCESRMEESWRLPIEEGIDFEGQHFDAPEGGAACATAQWLEPSLLSVSISVSAKVTAPCARCLKETPLEISDVLMYLYYSRGLELGRDTELASDDGFMPVEVDYLDRVLDVGPQVEESLLLLLPTKVLCREDCAGLCPHCGADLNEGRCSCVGGEGDPRLEALRFFSPDEKA
ncbi:DUF177 domain-containing protein [Fretibacterium fastidiosum]|uniref:Predicted metal-binding, possibly nucleic acid-binding protein n=1 Tax=Fretibacterium fastidiosum TaxID=651822 RepID=A0AB94IXA9_9BACT|nr:DUF177 domain-containing protein [Fretibacterium fastidiosum]CBL28422.1 Predicted metal-binding, possibly nucleic acid-binding protein [Fretibacterium fastidiosum]